MVGFHSLPPQSAEALFHVSFGGPWAGAYNSSMEMCVNNSLAKCHHLINLVNTIVGTFVTHALLRVIFNIAKFYLIAKALENVLLLLYKYN